eukprot:CAMPEP_0197175394 /NCGR_PEP_ID=MMETSP1423-20130617/1623_1 /TAXON_ID=476441 /ORGANISM="Pseudo-nitzschia heimii, Strain UNC1101" /LENGTH=72 /DNA_ID=CAMNT_0042624539 /DNA_START=163 /DNA_END=381 /DNA_ORIENTATION=-
MERVEVTMDIITDITVAIIVIIVLDIGVDIMDPHRVPTMDIAGTMAVIKENIATTVTDIEQGRVLKPSDKCL